MAAEREYLAFPAEAASEFFCSNPDCTFHVLIGHRACGGSCDVWA